MASFIAPDLDWVLLAASCWHLDGGFTWIDHLKSMHKLWVNLTPSICKVFLWRDLQTGGGHAGPEHANSRA